MSVDSATGDTAVDTQAVATRRHVGAQTTIEIAETDDVTVIVQRHDRAAPDEVQAALDELAGAVDGGAE